MCQSKLLSTKNQKQASFQKILELFTNICRDTTFILKTADGGINPQYPEANGADAVSTVTFYQHQVTQTDVVLFVKNLVVQYYSIASGLPTFLISVGILSVGRP